MGLTGGKYGFISQQANRLSNAGFSKLCVDRRSVNNSIETRGKLTGETGLIKTRVLNWHGVSVVNRGVLDQAEQGASS